MRLFMLDNIAGTTNLWVLAKTGRSDLDEDPLRLEGLRGSPSNALPFSGEGAAESVPRCYTNVTAAASSAATAC